MNSIVSAVGIWGRMVKLSHSVFALPFAVVSAFLAGRHLEPQGWPGWGRLGLILLCMVSGRSVAMTFNRIVDAEIDARNPRTAMRPLPAGHLTRFAAFVMLIISIVTFGLGCMGFFLFYENTWPIVLSGPVLAHLCAYSFTKRLTRWSHFYLGSAIAISPLAAWIAIHPASVGASALLLMLVVACWIAGFDIIYACQDIEADRREGLHSLPSRMGPAAALWIARAAHAITVTGLIALGFTEHLGIIFYAGTALVAALLIIENNLVRPGDYRRVNLAFFTVNGIVSIVFAFAAIVDLSIH